MYTVDASVWVNAFDQREPGHLVSRQFLEVVRDRALPIIVPNLALVEVAGAISRTRQAPVQAHAFAMALSRLSHVTVRVLDEVCTLHALTLTREQARGVFDRIIPPHCAIWVATLDERVVAYLVMKGTYIDRLYIDPCEW